jgi:hypothetical protein
MPRSPRAIRSSKAPSATLTADDCSVKSRIVQLRDP